MNKTRLLFFVILAEGYIVLACELLAIRQLIPFVGSGAETISIIISAVLLPLAIGYHSGGHAYGRLYQHALTRGRAHNSVRKILLRNILSALAILTLGLSYPFLEMFFGLLHGLGLHHRLLQTTAYSLLFLVTPIYLLGQTVPLVSNYFSRRKLSDITGKMLFFSTAGSFLGSVFSTIVLMTLIGVHNTVIVTMGLLCVLGLLLGGHRARYERFFIILAFSVVVLMNNTDTMRSFDIVENNAYNMVSIEKLPKEDATLFVVNRSASSKLAADPKRNFGYLLYIDQTFIDPIEKLNLPPKDILIIGAGGFTLGLNDHYNNYHFIDIDKRLKQVAEDHFLPEKLGSNKTFEAASARAYVHNSEDMYDIIIIDAYTNVKSIPMECTTREFLLDTKKRLKPGGVIIANVISSPSWGNKFAVRYHNTFASVFPLFTRQVINGYTPWKPSKNSHNILYIYQDTPLAGDRTVYTDDKNTHSFDSE